MKKPNSMASFTVKSAEGGGTIESRIMTGLTRQKAMQEKLQNQVEEVYQELEDSDI